MMYNNKFVACLKSNGRVLREQDGTVFLNFGSEYSIYLKNLNTVRAEVTISIDGQDIMDGNSLVLGAYQDVNLERYLKDVTKGNRFKFIERTASVEKHRGIGAEDGLIRIEFAYEKPINKLNYVPDWNTRLGGPVYGGYAGNNSGHYTKGLMGNSFSTNAVGSFSDNSLSAAPIKNTATLCGVSETQCSAKSVQTDHSMDWLQTEQERSVLNDAGITVPGSISEQKFQVVAGFQTEDEKHVIILRLLGETADNKPVVKPVTVKAKPKCVTCGRVNKATAKFCQDCGTSLNIIE